MKNADRVIGACIDKCLPTRRSTVGQKNDYRTSWWYIGFTEPAHMTVWVETSAVEDIKGRIIYDIAAGGSG